jgi:hypothetical protein
MEEGEWVVAVVGIGVWITVVKAAGVWMTVMKEALALRAAWMVGTAVHLGMMAGELGMVGVTLMMGGWMMGTGMCLAAAHTPPAVPYVSLQPWAVVHRTPR